MGGQTYYFACPEGDQNRNKYFCTEEVHSSDADSLETECSCCVLQTLPGTPLQFAALAGSEAIVRLLLEAGAEINEGGGIIYEDRYDTNVCTDGTALELAQREGHTGVINILLEAHQAVENSRLQSETLHDYRDESFPEGEKETLDLPPQKRVRV